MGSTLSRGLIIFRGEEVRDTVKACLKRAQTLSGYSIFYVCLVFSFALSHKDSVKQLTIAAVFSMILTLLSGLLLYAIYPLFISDTDYLRIRHYMFFVMIELLNGSSLMCSNVILLALINPAYKWFYFVLVPLPFVIIIYAWHTNPTKFTSGSSDADFKTAIKSCSDLCLINSGITSAMHTHLIFKSFQYPSHSVNDRNLLSNDPNSMILAVTLLAMCACAFSLMFTALPLEFLHSNLRSKLSGPLKFLQVFPLFLIETASMIMGSKFLGGLSLLAITPTIIIFVVYLSILISDWSGQDNIKEPRDIPVFFASSASIFTVILCGVDAVYSVPVVGNYTFHLKVAVLAVVAGILTSLNSVAVFSLPHGSKQAGPVLRDSRSGAR